MWHRYMGGVESLLGSIISEDMPDYWYARETLNMLNLSGKGKCAILHTFG